MKTRSSLYLTTPIYYVNDTPHIGHAYTTILADAVARYGRLFGQETFFLTGTDEHGEKVQKAAAEQGRTPQTQSDLLVKRFQELWDRLQITNDDFLRTTQERHKQVVRQVLAELYGRGDIYRGTYTGWYCVPCEQFCTETDLVDGTCPDCRRAVEELEETNYFFRLSAYQEWLIEYIQAHPDFIRPDFRRNETLGLLRKPLQDLCISRPKSRIAWGIELPFDPDYVCYVWFDALLNYLTAVGFQTDDAMFRKWWPVQFHLIGKDILKTHTIYWPAMLKSIGLELPRTIFAHGWWLLEGGKISKSKGNVVDPLTLLDEFGTDAFRYYLLADMPVGQDTSFSKERFIVRYNSDLANNVGNLANRVLKLIAATTGGKIPALYKLQEVDRDFQQEILDTIPLVEQAVSDLKIHIAIDAIVRAVKACNHYLETTEPWALKKDAAQRDRLETILYTALEGLRIISGLVFPVIPEKMTILRQAMGLKKPFIVPDIARLRTWGISVSGESISPIKVLFPRIEEKQSGKIINGETQ